MKILNTDPSDELDTKRPQATKYFARIRYHVSFFNQQEISKETARVVFLYTMP